MSGEFNMIEQANLELVNGFTNLVRTVSPDAARLYRASVEIENEPLRNCVQFAAILMFVRDFSRPRK